MNKIKEIFGKNIFNDASIKKRLSKNIYQEFIKAVEKNQRLSEELADKIAKAMKNWAIEKGATHYTHWFQPLTGSTAEKHDSFLNPIPNGEIELEFSGKELIQGEPDASSFPSGGLRSTYEARGYTSWDYTSPAFLKEDTSGVTLCIPTAFCSYNGYALDKKTPLIRSMQAISKESLKVLKILGHKNIKSVISNVGAEQEYFLIDKRYFSKRLDLITSGRTLFGSPAPKGQELDDHYFGQIKDRVADFMRDLDIKLWEMGICAKSKHNEVAPSQFELALVYTIANIAADQNQIVMETMKKVALRHNLICLLHEKPYKGVNGSGKHNNWSLMTNTGINLFEPGKTPQENNQFLLFLVASLRAFDKHADLLRASASNLGNDYRLGGSEAPTPIISIFLGEILTDILLNIEKGTKKKYANKDYLELGINTLNKIPKDNTDRNRTSALAFTGNKFEFRMVPSSASISMANVVLNTALAQELSNLSNFLSNSSSLNTAIMDYLKENISKSKRIIFNGDNYSKKSQEQAKKLGLPIIKSTPWAISSYNSVKAKKLFSELNVLSHQEINSRTEIYFQRYYKQSIIEAKTVIQMVSTQYFPVIINYIGNLAKSIQTLKNIESDFWVQENILKVINKHFLSAHKNLSVLKNALEKLSQINDFEQKAHFCFDKLSLLMLNLRVDIDALEGYISKDIWPVPSYSDMMFKL